MTFRRGLAQLARAAADLALGSVCAGCAELPGLLCGACRDTFAGPALLRSVPGETGLCLSAAADYAGPVRSAILDHKEQGRLPLARPLGDALAVAVTALLEHSAGCGHGDRPVALVPAPSARPAVRARGHDSLARISRRAAVTLRRSSQEAVVVRAFRHTRRVDDQAGLDRQARAENLRGAIAVRQAARRPLGRRCVVVVDDVVTTGATLRECETALLGAGLSPCGAAVVAIAR